MKLVPSSPVVFILIIVAFFAAGMLFGKMFSKKKVEKFDSEYMGEFNTPSHMEGGPRVLPKVPENKGVISGDTYCKMANC